MHRGKKIGLVLPAYNEEKLIGRTLDRVPPIIDEVFVVDDKSPDNQNAVVRGRIEKDQRIRLISHETNQGPGGSIITGYLAASKSACDIVVVVGADDQMDLSEVERFIDPIIEGRAHYTKGNRFHLAQFRDTVQKMPRIRFFGNWLITALTKVASGYYKVMDVVDGYTAISKDVIDTVDWSKAWKKYGYPMDFLIRLNAYGFKTLDVPRTAIYLPGERQSQIKGLNYALKVSPMLLKHFFWRLHFKYLYFDFHPLVFFYYLGFLLLPIGMILGLCLVANWIWWGGVGVTGPRSVLVSLCFLSGIQFLLFAMFFDMQEGK